MERQEIDILRDLAKKQAEIANSPEMEQLREQWKLHNDCKSDVPMITVETRSFCKEVTEGRLRCKDETARKIESDLWMNIYNHLELHDDTIVEGYIPVTCRGEFVPFDIELERRRTESGGLRTVPVLEDLEKDFYKLHKSKIVVQSKEEVQNIRKNPGKGLRGIEKIKCDICGDILPPKFVGISMFAVPMQNIVNLMSMDNMYLAMIETPDLFSKMLRMLTDDYRECFLKLQENNCLDATTGPLFLGQATYCSTSMLPSDKEHYTIKDVWGFMDAQETSGISPQMYEALVFPHYKKLTDMLGALSYGCCEPVDPIWENCLSKLSNLRRVSVSPWCNEEKMGEYLQGKKIVYHRKPNPNFLGVGDRLDQDALRQHIRKTLKAAKGCTIEFTQRDVLTINHNPSKVKEYVKILREECNRKD